MLKSPAFAKRQNVVRQLIKNEHNKSKIRILILFVVFIQSSFSKSKNEYLKNNLFELLNSNFKFPQRNFKIIGFGAYHEKQVSVFINYRQAYSSNESNWTVDFDKKITEERNRLKYTQSLLKNLVEIEPTIKNRAKSEKPNE